MHRLCNNIKVIVVESNANAFLQSIYQNVKEFYQIHTVFARVLTGKVPVIYPVITGYIQYLFYISYSNDMLYQLLTEYETSVYQILTEYLKVH